MGQVLKTKIKKPHPAATEKLHDKIHINTFYFTKPKTALKVYHLKEHFELYPYQVLMDSLNNII